MQPPNPERSTALRGARTLRADRSILDGRGFPMLLTASILITVSAVRSTGQLPLATSNGSLYVRGVTNTVPCPPGPVTNHTNCTELSFFSHVDTTTLMLDYGRQHGSLFSQGLANLNIVYAKNPTVDVQTSVAQRDENATTSKDVQAIASGIIRYKSRLLFRTPPPFFDGGYPAHGRVQYALTNFGTANAVANVRLQITDDDGFVIFNQTKHLGIDPVAGEFAIDGLIEPNSDFEILMEANASSRVPVGAGAAGVLVLSDTQAIIGARTSVFPPPNTAESEDAPIGALSETPFFTLDQEAFDAIHGENSYDLNEYLYFDYSSNLIEPLDLGDLNLAAARQGNQVVVTFDPIAGINHIVEVSESLAEGSWDDLPGAPHNSGTVSETVDPEMTGRYYRVRSTSE